MAETLHNRTGPIVAVGIALAVFSLEHPATRTARRPTPRRLTAAATPSHPASARGLCAASRIQVSQGLLPEDNDPDRADAEGIARSVRSNRRHDLHAAAPLTTRYGGLLPPISLLRVAPKHGPPI